VKVPSLALVALLPVVAQAAMAEVPVLAGRWLPGIDAARLEEARPGDWVEYRLTLDGRPVGGYVRYVHGGREAEGIRLEIWVSSRPGSGTLGFELWLERLHDGRYRLARIRRRWMGGETTEIPVESGETELEESSAVAEGELASTPAAVMTEAGVLSARRVELRREGRPAFRIWFSETVPILGIARAEHPGGVGWELLAYGDSSRLLFDEAGAKR